MTETPPRSSTHAWRPSPNGAMNALPRATGTGQKTLPLTSGSSSRGWAQLISPHAIARTAQAALRAILPPKVVRGKDLHWPHQTQVIASNRERADRPVTLPDAG